ncbi:hypothetical protein COLSTE_02058 [Collinsella stercoris DSM 13279]|uniref:Uncharacterized protein n=1 Tax=Collinsella stercoris DSM 13279 TaxID=445975 RepID=B6GD80_9ACTN|nr:hypothetical protein COLSTE_02058 [Collinsella stercoris DSM 13279]
MRWAAPARHGARGGGPCHKSGDNVTKKATRRVDAYFGRHSPR